MINLAQIIALTEDISQMDNLLRKISDDYELTKAELRVLDDLRVEAIEIRLTIEPLIYR